MDCAPDISASLRHVAGDDGPASDRHLRPDDSGERVTSQDNVNRERTDPFRNMSRD